MLEFDDETGEFKLDGGDANDEVSFKIPFNSLPRGPKGLTGIGISKITQEDVKLIVTLTNGQVQEFILPIGPKGDSIKGDKGDSIVGPKGDSIRGELGSQIHTGQGIPKIKALPNDIYIDAATGDLYSFV